jgi:hypothetical protein
VGHWLEDNNYTNLFFLKSSFVLHKKHPKKR